MESSADSNNGEVKKKDDNDNIFIDEGVLSLQKRRSSVIDSIGGGGGGSGASFEECATLGLKSLSASDASVLESPRSVTPETVATETLQPDLTVKKESDKVDAHVKIFDDSENTSVSGAVTAFMPVPKDADRYNMNHKNRGKCVIFNHEEFEMTGFERREGSTTDAKKLQKSFGNLGFDVKIHDNLTYKEVIDVLDELSTKTDHKDSDCICVIVLTHGLQNDLISSKDAAYKTDKLWKPFTADNCPSLAGKPKLFFIQACRGDEIDNGVVLSPRSAISSTDSVASYKIPTHSDILIAHSSAQGFYTWRSPEYGTWYISCLCEVLDEYGAKLDLLSMLTITARKVATEYASYVPDDPNRHEKKQAPSLTSLLIRNVYFTPK